ncbi:MAG: peptidoglycan-binding protein [Oscillospiraceae bacterium]|nr:peptidoglycan-binding protein [Oscillospiraceae bacterium]
MKYSIKDDIRIAEVSVKDFRVILFDGSKKSMGKNRCNAGYFGAYSEKGEWFTLPSAHLVADYEATSKWTKKYCTERGKFKCKKFTFDASKWSYDNEFHGKAVSTLIVDGGRATITDVVSVPKCQYAVSGAPVLIGGKYYGMVKAAAQGWTSGNMRATWHVFLGVKSERADTVCVMALRTASGNLLSTSAVANRFKALGMRDVIKLDGGGSFYFNVGGTTLSTAENRRVCSIIDMGAVEGNPYAVPTVTLSRGVKNTAAVCWLQWELRERGYKIDVDGSFGPATLAALRAYQKASGLEVDGYCGVLTRASLTK